ncbi:ATP-binding protein [Amycolatopsis sp. FDAARGOS 1241]|uniref:ATP-binding protein n=1 Tax=Amycolatopsis sp. FDAARGOS 1241 TaxID=2778070 RepID=UPI00194E088F|nr:ATP-binding protein [Amycolatopsis sp. FDAARGOS 1241]QRP48820.1 ATP-binding protein [Amycolatopsis sp. FDAARGOS 1241]
MEVSALTSAECPLPETVAGLAAARDFTRATLARWGLPTLADDAVLVVSELATNAVLHGTGTASVRLSHAGSVVRIEVADESPAVPAKRSSGADGGWGLRLVELLSLAWGVTPTAGGKVVWCDLAGTAGQ